jgi:hypothetical protein
MTSMEHGEIMAWETDGGQGAGPVSIQGLEDLIERDPIAAFRSLPEAELERIEKVNPALIGRLVEGYMWVSLGDIDA